MIVEVNGLGYKWMLPWVPYYPQAPPTVVFPVFFKDYSKLHLAGSSWVTRLYTMGSVMVCWVR